MANAWPEVKKLQTALSLHATVRSPERKGSHYASTGAPVLYVVYERPGLGEGSVFPRIREIIDEDGGRLRVSVAVDPGGALITLELPDRPDALRLVLDPLGAELLGSYIMSARLALPHGLPDEDTQRGLTRRFRLVVAPAPVIEVTQGTSAEPFQIPARYWDKLYAELCLVVAHTRDLDWHRPVQVH